MKLWTVKFLWAHGTRFRIWRVKVVGVSPGYTYYGSISEHAYSTGRKGYARFNVSVDGGRLLYCTSSWANVRKFCHLHGLGNLRSECTKYL